jgi:GTP cyclohydrolase I
MIKKSTEENPNLASTIRDSLPDCASETDHRGLAIQDVGVRDLKYPITVLDKAGEMQSTVGTFSLSVALADNQKGTHMSRFLEILNEVHGELTVRNLPGIMRKLQARLEANSARLEVAFPYFVNRQAPVSKAPSMMDYEATFLATIDNGAFDFVLGVRVPTKSLCPCSKSISDFGAHNQRCYVDVQVRSDRFLWIEDLIEEVESCSSSPVYGLLKREDEKHVTEQAYLNARFVEDVVRDTAERIASLDGARWVRTTAESVESIHNHNAFATIEISAPTEEPDLASEISHTSEVDASKSEHDDLAFGSWLKSCRQRQNLGQSRLAEMLGVSNSFLSRVERGERGVSRELALSIATALGSKDEEVLVRAGYFPESWASRIEADLGGLLSWASGNECLDHHCHR